MWNKKQAACFNDCLLINLGKTACENECSQEKQAKKTKILAFLHCRKTIITYEIRYWQGFLAK